MDARKLAHLESFAAFIEFLSNPGEYQAMIDDAKATLAEWREVNEKARGIKDIDAWQVSVKQGLERREVELAGRETAFAQSEEAAKAARQKANDARTAAMAKLSDKLKAVEAKEAELTAALAMKADLVKWEQALNAQSDKLDALDKDLKEKMAKLSKLMAGD